MDLELHEPSFLSVDQAIRPGVEPGPCSQRAPVTSRQPKPACGWACALLLKRAAQHHQQNCMQCMKSGNNRLDLHGRRPGELCAGMELHSSAGLLATRGRSRRLATALAPAVRPKGRPPRRSWCGISGADAQQNLPRASFNPAASAQITLSSDFALQYSRPFPPAQRLPQGDWPGNLYSVRTQRGLGAWRRLCWFDRVVQRLARHMHVGLSVDAGGTRAAAPGLRSRLGAPWRDGPAPPRLRSVPLAAMRTVALVVIIALVGSAAASDSQFPVLQELERESWIAGGKMDLTGP